MYFPPHAGRKRARDRIAARVRLLRGEVERKHCVNVCVYMSTAEEEGESTSEDIYGSVRWNASTLC